MCLSFPNIWSSNSRIQSVWLTQERMTKRGHRQKSNVWCFQTGHCQWFPNLQTTICNVQFAYLLAFLICYILRLAPICYNSFWETGEVQNQPPKQIASINYHIQFFDFSNHVINFSFFIIQYHQCHHLYRTLNSTMPSLTRFSIEVKCCQQRRQFLTAGYSSSFLQLDVGQQ